MTLHVGTHKREFFIDNLLARIPFIIVIIRLTGLAPWDFSFPFPGSLTSTFLDAPEMSLQYSPEPARGGGEGLKAGDQNGNADNGLVLRTLSSKAVTLRQSLSGSHAKAVTWL